MLCNMFNMVSNKFIERTLSIDIVCMSESLSPPSNEVKIKLRHRDWEVEITCLESKVKQVVEDVLSGIDTSTTLMQGLNAQIAEFQKEINSLKLQVNTDAAYQDGVKRGGYM
jgi:hypothetical protein